MKKNYLLPDLQVRCPTCFIKAAKKTILLLFFALIAEGISAQSCTVTATNPWEWPSHSNWFIGNGLKGNFSGGALVVSPQPNLTSYEGTTGASDDKGHLLFLSNGRLLWNANGALTYSGLLEGNEGFMTNGSASQGVVTVRHPLDTSSYYIFTVDDAQLPVANGLNYFVFDRNGNLLSGPVSLGGYRTAEGIAATKHFNGVDIWISVYASGTNKFYTYLLTCNGVISPPVISPVAPVFSGQKERGGLAFSWDGKYFAQGHPDYFPDSDKEVSVYKFDNYTGVISDPHHISSAASVEGPYDLLFSPDNSKLYLSSSTGTLSYYDITSWNTSTMAASNTYITGVSTGSHAAIEIGGDGNLYMSTLGTGLGKLSGSMNSGNLAYSNMAGAITNRGLPTMYIPPAEEPDILEVGPFCDTDPPVNLSTFWLCNGLNAEDSLANLSVYTGTGITNTIIGIFDPAVAGAGTHMIIFRRCNSDDTTYIVVDPCACPDTTLSPIPPLCADGTINLNNYKITTEPGTWSISSSPVGSTATLTGSTFHANNTVPGVYVVRFTLSSPIPGCPDYSERTIIINPLPTVTISVGTIACNGQAATLTASGANTYTWCTGVQGNSIIVSPTQSGYYSVTGFNTNACSDKDSVLLTVPAPIVLTTNSTNPGCGTLGSVTATATGGTGTLFYLWNDSLHQTSSTISGLHAGAYVVLVTDSNGCTQTASVDLSNPVLPIAGFNVVSACVGIPVQFINSSIPGAGNSLTGFSWNLGDPGSGAANTPATSAPPPHLYTSTGIDSFYVSLLIIANNGCKDSINKWVHLSPVPVVHFGRPESGCAPVCDHFTNSTTISGVDTNLTWSWNFGDPSSGATNLSALQAPAHCYTQAGSYNVSLTAVSGKGCANSLTINNLVNVYPVPQAAFTASPEATQIFDPEISLFDQSTGTPVYWHWDFGVPDTNKDTSLFQNPVWAYTDTGTYTICLHIENAYGCTDSTCSPVLITDYYTFYIPNSFSPNGDGANDFFNGKGYNIIDYQLWIFDRWGDMIYTTGAARSPESSVPWNGKANNSKEVAQEDVYIWKVNLVDLFSKTHTYTGRVTLIK